MPLMGSIYVGTSGLQTSQNSLNTTAHNLSNLDTQGYVRQQVLHADRVYNTIKAGTPSTSSQQVGLGVTYDKVRQVRDYFLDKSYRRENGRTAFYSTQYESITEVEDLLDEFNDEASFNYSMTKLWETLNELAKTPDDTTVQRMLVQNAQSFLTNATQVYQGLVDYQSELNNQIRDKVDTINKLGHQIAALNDEIRKIEVGGVESANDLRDVRNKALDELSGLAHISFEEDIYHAIKVQLEGVDFVTTDSVNEIGLELDARTGFVNPYWEINAEIKIDPATGEEKKDLSNAMVYNLYILATPDNYTDIGSLRSMLYVRGDKVADFTDIPVKPVMPEASEFSSGASDPGYVAAIAQYRLDMVAYSDKVEYYNHTVSQSVCMNIQAEFDQLVHNVVRTINDVLKQAYDSHDGTYMADVDGSPLQLFVKKEGPGYTYNSTTGEWDEVPEDLVDDYRTDTLYSIPNLIINPSLIREAGLLKFKFSDNTVDYDTAKKLVDAFDADNYCLNPNVTTKCSLNTYYTNLVSQVSNTGSVYKNKTESWQATVDSIDHAREQVLGVSSDEEISYMIKFQNAFNAASRYINVVDEMLEHIITQLGS